MLRIDDIHAFRRDLGSNPSVKKIEYLFHRPFTKIDKFRQRLVDFPLFITFSRSCHPERRKYHGVMFS